MRPRVGGANPVGRGPQTPTSSATPTRTGTRCTHRPACLQVGPQLPKSVFRFSAGADEAASGRLA